MAIVETWIMTTAPMVSVGLPVYNGERYLRDALASLLRQDFQDFELIISDNASTDGTPEICRQFANRDRRVRYFRNDANIGANPNFNRTLELARAPLFRWAAHDDLVEPTYLSSCISMLESSPRAVLCHSLVQIIGPDSEPLGVYDASKFRVGSYDVAERFAGLILTRHLCTDIFGLVRTEALRQVGGLADYFGSDRATLAALGLIGRIVHVQAPLHRNRLHPHRYSLAVRPTRQRGKASSSVTPRRPGPPIFESYRDYWRAVRSLVPDADERHKCEKLLVKWWFVDWNSARLAVDVMAVVFPAIYDLYRRLKLHVVGPMPQIGLPSGPLSGMTSKNQVCVPTSDVSPGDDPGTGSAQADERL
jgi:glycosyltransferase involved in cell wall biosynthesis